MITNTTQNWEAGNTVRIGFISLQVVRAVATPGDHAPDAYILTSAKGQLYSFVPHRGLTKIDADEARQMIEAHNQHAARQAAAATAKANAMAIHSDLLNALLAA